MTDCITGINVHLEDQTLSLYDQWSKLITVWKPMRNTSDRSIYTCMIFCLWLLRIWGAFQIQYWRLSRVAAFLRHLYLTRQFWPLLEPHAASQRASRDADEFFLVPCVIMTILPISWNVLHTYIYGNGVLSASYWTIWSDIRFEMSVSWYTSFIGKR